MAPPYSIDICPALSQVCEQVDKFDREVSGGVNIKLVKILQQSLQCIQLCTVLRVTIMMFQFKEFSRISTTMIQIFAIFCV